MSTSPINISTDPLGTNATPEALEHLTAGYEPSQKPFDAFLRDKATQYGREERERDWLQYTKFVTGEKFFQGEQFGRVSRFDGSWRPMKRTAGDPIYAHNYVRGHALAILSQHVQSRTEIDVVPLPDGDAYDANKGSAKIAKAVCDHYERSLLTESFRQRESMFGQITGDILRYTFWNPAKGNERQRPQYEMEEVAGESVWTCADCGMSGGMEELGDAGIDSGAFGDSMLVADSSGGLAGGDFSADRLDQSATQESACPHCGSPALVFEEDSSVQLPRIAGYDSTKTGDIDTRCVPKYQVKFDRVPNEFRLIQWLRWREKVRPETVRAELPNFGSKRSNGDDMDAGLRATQTLQRSVGNVFGGQSPYFATSGQQDLYKDLVTVDRWWFKPSVYCDYVFTADFISASGETIPAGTRAKEAFPDGLFALFIADELADLRGEDLHKHWVHTQMILVPSRIDGDGILDDLIEPQQEINKIDGLSLANAMYVAGSGLVYRPEFINRSDIPSKPFDVAPIKPGTDPSVPLSEMMMYVGRPDLGQGVYVHKQQQLDFMTWATKNYPSSLGAPDSDNKTATGQSIASQGARSQRSPELALYAQMCVDWYAQVLALFQENATDEMYFPHQGRVGKQDGQWFKGSDLPSSFVVTMRPRSYIPKSEYERREDFAGFLGIFGGLEGLLMALQAAPELVEEAKERFNITFDIRGSDLTSQIARQRFEAMKAMLPQVEAAATAMGAVEEAPAILVQVQGAAPDKDDDHTAMIAWWVRLKHEDEGVEARVKNPTLYAAIDHQIATHKAFMVQNQQEQGQMAIAAAQPQMQLEQEQIGQQEQKEDEREEVNYQREREKQAADVEMSEQEQMRNAAMSERNQQHALAMQREKQVGAERLAKMKGAGAK